ncbi:MAG TPA: SIMPL domain-containing protein [Candidatus Elarobacter sp.]|nr:SIMPL domain-containing protein [Candidatus Elarobacter sp.]
MTSFRPRTSLLLAFAVLVAATGETPSAQPTATPVACAQPNVNPRVVHAVEPETPALAQQQNIGGTVQVIVSLDTNSSVTAVRILRSPSAILNAAALAAARQTTFQTQIRDCRPIAADYIYTVDFEVPPGPTTINGRPAIVITAVATASPAPDNAIVTVAVRGTPASEVSRAQPPAEAIAALHARLAAAGVLASQITETSSTSTGFGSLLVPGATMAPLPPPYLALPSAPPSPAVRPTPSYTISTNVRITVNAMRELPAVLAAVRATPGWYGGSVQYLLRDREPAYREALDRAVHDARGRAEVAARAAGMRVSTLARLEVDSADSVTAPPFPQSFASIGTAPLTPPAVPVRARVTATYLLVR